MRLLWQRDERPQSCSTQRRALRLLLLPEKERVAGERCPQKYIRAEKLERIAIRALEEEIFSEASMKKIAALMREGYAAMSNEADESRKALLQAKAAAEKNLIIYIPLLRMAKLTNILWLV